MTESGDAGPPARIVTETLLADDWARLVKYTVDYRRRDGRHETIVRQVYDRGDGVAVLPYDPDRGTVLLVRQFRMPVFLHGGDGQLTEACAGKLDDLDPEAAIRAELEEELGYAVRDLEPVFEMYMSPGSVGERLTLYTATYGAGDRVAEGGGRDDEAEDIEILEMSLDEAMAEVSQGSIRDAKTVILLQHLKLRTIADESP